MSLEPRLIPAVDAPAPWPAGADRAHSQKSIRTLASSVIGLYSCKAKGPSDAFQREAFNPDLEVRGSLGRRAVGDRRPCCGPSDRCAWTRVLRVMMDSKRALPRLDAAVILSQSGCCSCGTRVGWEALRHGAAVGGVCTSRLFSSAGMLGSVALWQR